MQRGRWCRGVGKGVENDISFSSTAKRRKNWTEIGVFPVLSPRVFHGTRDMELADFPPLGERQP